jgi:hypothetical protein
VRHERFTPSLSGSRRKCLLLVCAVIVLCFSQTAFAQSGRHPKKREPLPPLPTEPKPDPTLEVPSKLVAVKSIIVSGDVVHDSDYYRSNDVGVAVKACVSRLRERLGLEIVKGGKLKRKDAVDWAKKETAAYVLWLEIRVQDHGYRKAISYINYYVFMPQTGDVLTKGQYDPYKEVVRILGAPVPGTTGEKPAIVQLEDGGREIADRLIRLLQ